MKMFCSQRAEQNEPIPHSSSTKYRELLSVFPRITILLSQNSRENHSRFLSIYIVQVQEAIKSLLIGIPIIPLSILGRILISI
jgi:hypothetical protein